MTSKHTPYEIQEAIEKTMVHFILSNSYIVFLGAVIFGLIFDIYAPIVVFSDMWYPSFGAVMIVVGSALIYWAQNTSRCTAKEVEDQIVLERNFERGPYKYSRNPTHIGLTIMTLGLAVILNSFFSIIFLVIASLITKFIFLKKQEALLEQKYGKTYSDYKKKVSTWV